MDLSRHGTAFSRYSGWCGSWAKRLRSRRRASSSRELTVSARAAAVVEGEGGRGEEEGRRLREGGRAKEGGKKRHKTRRRERGMASIRRMSGY